MIRHGLDRLPAPAALLFDLDGTLVDTVGRRVAAWRDAFAAEGIPTDDAHLATLIGSDGRWLAREVARAAGIELDDDATERIDHRSGERFGELNHTPVPHDGVAALLESLDAARVPWSIATSSRREQVQTSVDALRLSHAPRVTDGSHVIHAKPAPDLLFEAAAQLGTPPATCWYVGDATWDMLAARAAGMTAIGVASGAVSEADLQGAGAHATYPDLRALHGDLTAWGMVGPPAD